MRRRLEIVIESGESTCGIAGEGIRCPQMRTTSFGIRWHCAIFSPPGEHLLERDGWLMRTPDCLGAEDAARRVRERMAEG